MGSVEKFNVQISSQRLSRHNPWLNNRWPRLQRIPPNLPTAANAPVLCPIPESNEARYSPIVSILFESNHTEITHDRMWNLYLFLDLH